MPQKDIYINICARIFFNTIFLAFTVFGLYLSFCDAYSYQGDYTRIFIISIVFSFIMCVLWTGNNVWCNIGLFIFNLGIAITIVRKCRLIENEFEILYGYIKRQYYIYENLGEVSVNDIRSHITVAGMPVYEKLALVLVIILIIAVASMALFRLKWNFLLLFPVLVIVGMEMMHGKAPSVKAASFFVYGMSGLLFSAGLDVCGGKKHFLQEKPVTGQMWTRYIVFTVIMALCITVASGAGRNTKDGVFIHSRKFLKRQHQIEKEIVGFAEKLSNAAGKEDRGRLDNNTPDQRGQFIFRIETDKKPANNIYIKAFSADIYQNGQWKSFNNITPPVSETNIGEQAYGSVEACIKAKSKVAESLDWTDSIDSFNMDIIKGFGFRKNELFTPYIYSIEGTDKYQYRCYNMQNWVLHNILSIDNTLREYYGIDDIQEYTSFVYRNYLKVPKKLKRLRKYASNIISGNDTGSMCMYIKDMICYDTKYSQKLKPVPSGQDYAEYFLFKQKKGYCEHYATAGTLLLRLKGIPARYASGYLIRPSEFELENDKSGNEKYVSYVKDYNAHAWTEVYKEGFGWIPFDMTNPVREEDDTNISGNFVSVPSSLPQDDFTQDINNNEEDTSSEEEEETEDLNSMEENPGVLDENGPVVNNKEPVYLKKEIFLIPAVLLILLMPFIYIRIRFKLLLRKAGNAGTPDRRVIMYFVIFNNYLAFCGLRGISKLDDASYAERIASILENRESVSACDILQRAVFSNKSININEEDEVALFIKNASGRAYENCSKPARFIIYILTGRKEINIFTKACN